MHFNVSTQTLAQKHVDNTNKKNNKHPIKNLLREMGMQSLNTISVR